MQKDKLNYSTDIQHSKASKKTYDMTTDNPSTQKKNSKNTYLLMMKYSIKKE